MPASIVGIKQQLGTVRILQELKCWATIMQTARAKISRPFTFRMRVTRTQADRYQCGRKDPKDIKERISMPKGARIDQL